jgi:nitrogen fixation protein NifB
MAVASRVPQLSVLGIAGPGDACCNFDDVRRTFELVRRNIPDLKLCVSTNGLGLVDCIDALVDLDVTHVTITINMVDPEVGQHIYPWVYFRHRRWTGLEASKILHDRQMEGLEALTSRKILVKVNSVMIPGINDEHLLEVHKVVSDKGIVLHNVMPLISDPAHGTRFGLSGQREPTHEELARLRDRLGSGARAMRHCRQCRADAVGMLGEDLGAQFTMDRIKDSEAYDPSARDAYRVVAERERSEHQGFKRMIQQRLKSVSTGPTVMVGVASKGGGRINEHFGHAKEFHVFEVSPNGVRLIGQRKVPNYCQGGWGNDDSIDAIVDLMRGVTALLCAKVGECPRSTLAEAGIEVCDTYAHAWLEEGIANWYMDTYAISSVEKTA